MTSIVIRSPNGIANDTVVSLPDGTPIRGITAVDVRIRADGLVEATLQFEGVELDLTAQEVTAKRKPGFWERAWGLFLGEVGQHPVTCRASG
jgi:hypothetical protein